MPSTNCCANTRVDHPCRHARVIDGQEWGMCGFLKYGWDLCPLLTSCNLSLVLNCEHGGQDMWIVSFWRKCVILGLMVYLVFGRGLTSFILCCFLFLDQCTWISNCVNSLLNIMKFSIKGAVDFYFGRTSVNRNKALIVLPRICSLRLRLSSNIKHCRWNCNCNVIFLNYVFVKK